MPAYFEAYFDDKVMELVALALPLRPTDLEDMAWFSVGWGQDVPLLAVVKLRRGKKG